MIVCVNGVVRDDLQVLYLKRSYIEPWSAMLRYSGRHDPALGFGLPKHWDRVVISVGTEGTTTTTEGGCPGHAVFRGEVVEIEPGGVAAEGIDFLCKGRRFRLENEPVRINGRGHYIWNRRGYRCGTESGEDSPGRDGGKWTAGEIIVDILEHALGWPDDGSAIEGHHSCQGCIIQTYLTSDDIASYDASEWLALDTVIGEFSVDDTPVAQALDILVGLAGGFYGWYIDPDGVLHLVNLDECAQRDVEAGELGHWQDEAGTDYTLLGNNLNWSLDGVYSTVVVEGADMTTEERPPNIEGTGNAGAGDEGELELVNEPWMTFDCAFRAQEQPKRLWSGRPVDCNDIVSSVCRQPLWERDLTPPKGLVSFIEGPRIYKGTRTGPKYYLMHYGAPSWTVNRVTGIIGFYWVPELGVEWVPGVGWEDVKLWGWYWARVPFLVQAGPEGNAYECFDYERTLTIYDPAFKHPTSWPIAGTEDDETAMELLAERMLEQRKDVRVQGELSCDGIDMTEHNLDLRFNVVNLQSLDGGTTTTTPPPCEPMWWERLAINAVEVVYDLASNATHITVANTFYMLEGYSEIKRRMEQNLFAQRELDLSEDVNECQVVSGSFDPDDEVRVSTTTGEPGTTTTTEPPSTTTTEAPTTTTTQAPSTTTLVPDCMNCDDLKDLCFDLTWDEVPCGGDNVCGEIAEYTINWEGAHACVAWPPEGSTTTGAPPSTTTTEGWCTKACGWFGGLGGTAQFPEEIETRPHEAWLIYKPAPSDVPPYEGHTGWFVLVQWQLEDEEETLANFFWDKEDDPLDCCNPLGCYVCNWETDTGRVWVTTQPCPTSTTTAAGTTTTEAPTTTTLAGTTTTTGECPDCDNDCAGNASFQTDANEAGTCNCQVQCPPGHCCGPGISCTITHVSGCVFWGGATPLHSTCCPDEENSLDVNISCNEITGQWSVEIRSQPSGTQLWLEENANITCDPGTGHITGTGTLTGVWSDPINGTVGCTLGYTIT